MTKEFVLPDIGEGIVECELLCWLVNEGDTVAEDQPVAEVMTDKATVQIPAVDPGKIVKLHYQQGDIARVHSPLYTIATVDENKHEAIPHKDEKQTSQPVNRDKDTEVVSPVVVDDVFKLPDIGEGIVECEIVKWHVAEGETVAEDQVIVDVMTDKAVVEIPAKHDAVITKLFYQQGDIAKVHAPLFSLTRTDVEVEKAVSSTKNATTALIKPQKTMEQIPRTAAVKVLASPAVRRIARENNLDLSTVKGSGKKGRILKEDICSTTAPPKYDETAHTLASDPSQHRGKIVPLRGVQAAMAKHMAASAQTIPHFSVSDEVEMDALIALRQALKPAFEQENVKLSFMPFFVKALSLALSAFPIVNSQLNDAGDALHYFDDHNIGFAVDSKVGLLVPNIKQVQQCSLFEIATQMQNIIAQARAGKLATETLAGGTITLSNIGVIGGITATPIINKPQVAIAAIGKMQKLPRYNEDNEVVPKHILQVSWSADHRIIDGATMVKFNNLWRRYLQSPSEMLMYLR
ncbi:dihydrolipoyllysine-residue acetyltransferase [Alteromonas sp. C1M14]|uniref:dihydrolipoyllysine-residue acetyltransferase n=1 Tax=Alteromonas sp. C1M14 TaxID=2841567 RepID=UPI001C09E9BD|nr:dihydrolipoyllysine-residue acetyltransferase [Alteromonas sp. C1M14]MBU2976914.1 dihydrolipoyllysine-residue acetyltransferase [Alteromonas sp. C1M14]